MTQMGLVSLVLDFLASPLDMIAYQILSELRLHLFSCKVVK